MTDLSPSMRTAIIAAYACGPLFYATDHVCTVECGAPIDALWSAIESCASRGLMLISNNSAENGRAIRAELTPSGHDLAHEIIGEARARRIRNGAGMIEPALSAVSRA